MDRIIEGNTYAECTDYENMFIETYWGRFIYPKSNLNKTYEEMKKIVDNRNKFIQDFDIKSKVYLPRSLQDYTTGRFRHMFDHTETYKTKCGGYVIITSPYREEPELAKLGFKKYDDMYSKSTTTYVLRIFNLKSYVHEYKEILKLK